MFDYSDLTVLVCSCDKYNDLWNPFFTLFQKNWPDFNGKIILNTESEKFSFENLDIKCFSFYEKGSNVPYGERILKHLNEINTPYVLVLMDDFFIGKPVDVEAFSRIQDYIRTDRNAACFTLDFIYDENPIKSDYDIFYKRPQYADFKANLLAGLWKTEVFISTWKKHESAWEYEEYASIRASFTDYDYYSLRKMELSPIDWRGKDWSYIQKGKWVRSIAEPMFKANNIEIDYSKRGFLNENEINTVRINSLSRRLTASIRGLGFIKGISFVNYILFHQKLQQIINRLSRGKLCKNYYRSYMEHLRRLKGERL